MPLAVGAGSGRVLHSTCSVRILRRLVLSLLLCSGSLCLAPANLAAWQTEKIFPGELAGLDQSEAMLIDDDQPLAAQQGLLTRLLYRARKATPASLRNFAVHTEGVSLAELIRTPKRYRGWVFRLQGTAESAEWVATGQTGPDAIEKFCRVRMRTENGQEVVVYAVSAPQDWTKGAARREQLDEPSSCYGFFALRPSSPEGAPGNPIFVARRVEWYPETGNSLARRGFDAGLLDLARAHNLRPLSEEESEAFYGLLAASGKEVAELSTDTRPVGFLELLAEPQQVIGVPVDFEATVRRVVPVAAAARHQLPQDRFYQVDAFFRLGDTPVEVRGSGGETIKYQTRFPVTVDTTRLSGPPTELVGKRVRVRGWLYRFWRYDSEFTERNAAGEGQLAPLIMARQLDLLPDTGSGIVSRLAYLAIAAAAMAIGFVWWVTRRGVPGRAERPPLPERIEF